MKFFFKNSKMEIWCCGFLNNPKIKEGKFLFPWTDPFWVKKAFNNNIVQLSTLINENITLIHFNKLKAYQNPIIMFTTITIITQDENRILPNGIRKRIIGGRTQIYERLKFNK